MLCRRSVAARPSTASRAVARRSMATAPKSFSFKIERPFKTHNITDKLPSQVEATGDELMSYWKLMTRMRRMEIAADALYKTKEIRGFCHLYNGQEAVATGVEAAITHEDHIITAYRDHAFMLGRGATVKSVLAELTGRVTGCSKGRGGSMHMYSKDTNFYGGNGIVGAQVPVGAGIAFAQKYKKSGKVALAFYGDGAANQGQIFEAYNMSALWKLPIIYVCENNQYGMGTSVARAAAVPSFYTRGDFVPGLWIDGMDVLAVKAGVKFAADWARAGKGPMVLEMHTYRYVGHSMSDPGTTYRSREEIDKVRESSDPIMKVKNRIVQNNVATEEQLKAIEKEIRAEVDEAVEFSKSSAWPPLDDTFKDIYNKVAEVRGQDRTIVHYAGKL